MSQSYTKICMRFNWNIYSWLNYVVVLNSNSCNQVKDVFDQPVPVLLFLPIVACYPCLRTVLFERIKRFLIESWRNNWTNRLNVMRISFLSLELIYYVNLNCCNPYLSLQFRILLCNLIVVNSSSNIITMIWLDVHFLPFYKHVYHSQYAIIKISNLSLRK